jgi:hypothetical protein
MSWIKVETTARATAPLAGGPIGFLLGGKFKVFTPKFNLEDDGKIMLPLSTKWKVYNKYAPKDTPKVTSKGLSLLFNHAPSCFNGIMLNRITSYLGQRTFLTKIEFDKMCNQLAALNQDFLPEDYVDSLTNGVTFLEDEDVPKWRMSTNVVIDFNIKGDGSDGTAYYVGNNPIFEDDDLVKIMAVDGKGTFVKGMMLRITLNEAAAMGFDVPEGTVVLGVDTIKRLSGTKNTEFKMDFYKIIGQPTDFNFRGSLSRQVFENMPEGPANDLLWDIIEHATVDPKFARVAINSSKDFPVGFVRVGGMSSTMMTDYVRSNVNTPTILLPKDIYSKTFGNDNFGHAVVLRYPSDGGYVVAKVMPHDGNSTLFNSMCPLGGDFDGDLAFMFFITSDKRWDGLKDEAVSAPLPEHKSVKGDVSITDLPAISKYLYDDPEFLPCTERALVEAARQVGDRIGMAMVTCKVMKYIKCAKDGTADDFKLGSHEWGILHGIIHAQKKPITKALVEGLKEMNKFEASIKAMKAKAEDNPENVKLVAYVKRLDTLRDVLRGKDVVGDVVLPARYMKFQTILFKRHAELLVKWGIADPTVNTPEGLRNKGSMEMIHVVTTILMGWNTKATKETPIERFTKLLKITTESKATRWNTYKHYIKLVLAHAKEEGKFVPPVIIERIKTVLVDYSHEDLMWLVALNNKAGRSLASAYAAKGNTYYIRALYMLGTKENGLADHFAAYPMICAVLESIFTGKGIEFGAYENIINKDGDTVSKWVPFYNVKSNTFTNVNNWNVFITKGVNKYRNNSGTTKYTRISGAYTWSIANPYGDIMEFLNPSPIVDA